MREEAAACPVAEGAPWLSGLSTRAVGAPLSLESRSGRCLCTCRGLVAHSGVTALQEAKLKHNYT